MLYYFQMSRPERLGLVGESVLYREGRHGRQRAHPRGGEFPRVRVAQCAPFDIKILNYKIAHILNGESAIFASLIVYRVNREKLCIELVKPTHKKSTEKRDFAHYNIF